MKTRNHKQFGGFVGSFLGVILAHVVLGSMSSKVMSYWDLPVVYKSYANNQCKFVEVKSNRVACDREKYEDGKHIVEWTR